MEALLEMPRGRLAQLRRMKTMLSNHSEDCLYLNMYVPREGESVALINHSRSLTSHATKEEVRKSESHGM